MPNTHKVDTIDDPRSADTPTTNIVVTDQQSWWNSIPPTARKVIVWSAIGLTLAGTAWLVFRFSQNKIRVARRKRIMKDTMGENPHRTWALQFQLAFDNDGWWGTNVPQVRSTLLEIPTQKDYQKVEKEYQALVGGEVLNDRLQIELTKSEMDEMRAIYMSKPQSDNHVTSGSYFNPTGWAKRLKAAFDYSWFGGMISQTDEDAIWAVFKEMKTQSDYKATSEVYASQYGVSLDSALDGELDWTYPDWREIILEKPKQ